MHDDTQKKLLHISAPSPERHTTFPAFIIGSNDSWGLLAHCPVTEGTK